MKRIIITGCGGPAGVNFVKSLRIAPEKFFIVGTDMNKYYLQLPEVDERFLVPKSTDSSYIDVLNEIISKTKCEFLHPQPDIEVRVISENREQLHAFTFLPSKKTIEICQDKWKSVKIWKKKSIPVPKSFLVKNEDDLNKVVDELGLPFWLRATEGAGGRGSTLVENIEQGKAWIKYWRLRKMKWNFLAQEYLPGKNIAFQSIWKDGEIVTSQARERIEYIYPHLAPSGVTGTPGVAVTVHRDDVNKIATDCVLAIDPNATGVFCVDLKENHEGLPCPTEINAGRFFTTSYFFSYAGVNMPYYYVKLAYGEQLPKLPKYNALPAGLYWIRHIDSGPILIKEENFKFSVVQKLNGRPKLIIFDLDGTILRLPINYKALREELKKIFKKFGIKSEFKPLLTSIDNSVSLIKKNFGVTIATKISLIAYKTLEKYELDAVRKSEMIYGAKRTLRRLKKLGFKLALFSRNGKAAVVKSLRKFGLRNYFDVIVTRDDVKKQKPHPEALHKILEYLKIKPSQALVVGDHPYDIMAAKNCGIKSVGILSKNIDEEQFKKFGAFKVINSISELIEISS